MPHFKKGLETGAYIGEHEGMAENDTVLTTQASPEEIQRGWHELKLKVEQLNAGCDALEKENHNLRQLIGRVIEHRQKSHGELVMLLTGLVSKLPINDIGVTVAKLVEHNNNVNEVLAALVHGKADAPMPMPAMLKALDQTKRDLLAAIKPAVEELVRLQPPLEGALLEGLVTQPESFFSPKAVRANRCFLKGHVPKERIVREFGEAALVFFNDLTTDPKLNPRPKPDEIALGFKNDFEALFQANPNLLPDKRAALLALYQQVQRSKSPGEPALTQRHAFTRLSFLIELLHYYENQNTEAPDVIFAQRLPALIEQLVVTGPEADLNDQLIQQAEQLLDFVIHPDHRQMVVNNVGKGGGTARTLKFVLKFRAEEVAEMDHLIPEFIRHLIPPRQPPPTATLLAVLKLIHPVMQRHIVKAIRTWERIRKEDAEALAKKLADELGLKGIEQEVKASSSMSLETERQIAWEGVKELIARRADPGDIATAIRDRLHARYDADEVKESWIILIEADVMTLIRTFCQLPYLADGSTDPIARAVMETYVTRLTHEKYAAAYTKVVHSLRNMFKAKPDSPTLVNFLALVKWVDGTAAAKLSADIGMTAHAAA